MASTPDGELDLTTLRPKSGLTARLMFDGGWTVLTILGLVFTAAGVGTIFLASFLISREQRYEREGRTVQGTVTRKDTYTTRSTTGTGRHRRTRTTTHYRVHYTFATEDGTRHSNHGNVPSRLWRSLSKGSSIEIEYLPDKPESNRPTASRAGWKAWLIVLFPVGFGGAGLLMLFFSVRRARKYAALLSNGRLTKAAVDRKEVRNDITINNRHPYDIHYTFALPDGTIQEGKDLILDRRITDSLEPGSPIGVIYMPADPSQCALFREKWMKFFQHGG